MFDTLAQGVAAIAVDVVTIITVFCHVARKEPGIESVQFPTVSRLHVVPAVQVHVDLGANIRLEVGPNLRRTVVQTTGSEHTRDVNRVVLMTSLAVRRHERLYIQ